MTLMSDDESYDAGTVTACGARGIGISIQSVVRRSPVEMAAGVELDILSTEKLNVTLVSERLWVGRILPPELHGCAWPLLKCLMSSTANSGERAGFFSFTQDEDELTLMMDDWCHHVFASSASASAITYMPRRWRAFEFRLGALAWEVPGVMSFLSTLMSESQISILKVASYDRDFLLVQETDVAGASRLIQARSHACELVRDRSRTQCDARLMSPVEDHRFPSAFLPRPAHLSHTSTLTSWQERLHLDVDCLKEAMQEKLATRRMGLAAGEGEEGEEGSFSQSRRAEAPDSEYGDGASSTDGRGGRAGSSRAAEESESDVAAGASDGAHPWSTDDSDGLYVKVLPTNLVVVRLQLAMLSLSTHALIQRLLFSSSRGRRCFWSYTHVEDEVSLIVDDLTLQDFPEEALVGGTSTRWRPLMLAGRSFAFNETGVVSAMFAPYEDGVPLLNISTFSTNVTLVEDSDIERALSAFKLPHKVLECEESDGED